jgi:hypothetical protein
MADMRPIDPVERGSFRQAAVHSWGRLFGVTVGLSLLGVLTAVSPAQAITTISQGYATKDPVSLGSIVALQKNTTDEVRSANVENADNILGVIISDSNSLLSLTNGEKKQVQVATSGIVQVLVSDINGTIKQGDQITASPINGVGMKATNNAKVVGIAQGDMSDNSRNAKEKVKEKDGTEKEVVLGQIPVIISVSYFFKQPEKTVIPMAVQNVANALAGKTVKPLPIIISAAIFIISLVTVVSIVYSLIRASIISVGRNPMSQAAIYRNLMQISALVLVIMGVTFVAIYMILTRL